MRGRWGLASLVVAGMALAPSAARAQANDRVLAEALFREGRDLMDQNKISEACAKFAESYRLDHALGTIVNLALCHEKEGKTASAWAEFTDAAAEAAAQKDDRESFAKRHAQALEAELPRLRLAIAPATAGLATLEIKLDGSVIGKAAWSTQFPVDPGEHELGASADGKKPFTLKFVVPKGTGMTNAGVPQLDDAPKAIEVKATTSAPEPIVNGGTQRTLGYIVSGVGVAGIAGGAAFGMSAISLKGDRNARCDGGFCDAGGLRKDDHARTAATISTISFIAGGAVLAGGIVLILTAPKHQVNVGIGPGNATVGGSF